MSSARVTVASDAQTSNGSLKLTTGGLEHASAPARDATSSPLTSLPPSSPPLPPGMAAHGRLIPSSEAMPPPAKPGRKRSNDEMQEDTKSVESSQTVMPKIAQLAQQGKNEDQDIDSSFTMMPHSQMQGRSQVEQRPDEPLPSSVAHSQRLPPSAQGHKANSKAPKPLPTKAGTKRDKKPAKEQVDDEGVDDENGDEDSITTDSSDDVGEPQDAIQVFDWSSLNERYHNKMTEFQNNERAILQEFGQLIEYFHIWAESGNAKESDRSFKRFKTQEFYVHHEEDELETKRKHYIRVVAAFQTVAQLLVEHSPNLAKDKDVFMRQHAGKPTNSDNKERPRLKVKLSASIPNIKHEDLAVKVAGDIDMRNYRYRGYYGSRCVIL